MHCCLDVQSNFIFNKQNFIFERKVFFAFSDINRNTIYENNLNDHFLIRAPPSLGQNLNSYLIYKIITIKIW